MKKQRLVFLILIAAVLQGCNVFMDVVRPEGSKLIDVHSVSDFNKIAISGKMSLELVNGEQELRIETFENVHEYIETSVRNGELIVKTRNNTAFSKDPQITVFVTADLINRVSMSGSSNGYFANYKTNNIAIKTSGSSDTRGSLTASSIELSSSGSSETDLQVDCTYLTNKHSGSSEYKLNGRADNYEIDCSGSSKIEAFGLETKYTTVKSSGSAKIDVTVQETLNVSISGSGRVRYKGSPQVSEKISGSGRVMPM